jgi:multiple sugar transport system permease protein
MRTVPVGLTLFSSEVGTAYEQLMAASVLAIIPVLILFFFTQKQFIQGVARTGIK